MKQMVELAKRALFNRRFAYLQTFNVDNKSNEIVLMDLARFCRAHKSTFMEDPRQHALLEGRREVWLRIQNHLQLDDEILWKLHEATEPK